LRQKVASTQVAGLLPTSFAYDSKGRLASATQGTRQTTFSYDANGFLASVTDPLNRKHSFIYDADGRVLTSTLADERVITFRHDANGNLTSITPPGESEHAFSYTAVDLPSTYTPPSVAGTGATIYSYNPDRQPMKVTRPDGGTIDYGYDSAGRLKSLTTPTATIEYSYSSATGNLSGASVVGGEDLTYEYEGPLRTSSTWTGRVAGSVSRAYNNNFWVTSESIDGGDTIAFTYDNDGLVTQAGALTLTPNRTNGLLTGTSLGLATDARTYNSFGELTGYTASYKGGALYSVTLTRDAGGRVSTKSETIGGATNAFIYNYDPAGRLTGVTENGKSISTYGYDTNSNRLKATTPSGTVSATYDAQDRLLTYGAASFTYTGNGELESQTVSGKTTTYSYDALGNLIAATLPNGTKITYVIDAENRRVCKEVNGALEEGFLYDGGRIVAQLNGSNAGEA
jgi:YD repeat-containing protein